MDITPPIGFRMSGYFYERFSTAIHNPLQAKVIVFQQGHSRFAWAFCDLVGVPAKTSALARDAAEAMTGIPSANILIAATHTHTGPLYFGPLRDFFHAQAVERTTVDEREPTDYAAELADKLAGAITIAAEDAAQTEVFVNVVPQDGLSFNRRYVMKDGSVATNPGKLNPNVERAAGPTDNDLTLLQFRRSSRPIGGLTVFALHLDTTGGTEFSADFPYYLERDLRERYGPEYRSLFAIGPCGDVNHFDISQDRRQKGQDEAERIGSTIAATAIAALQSPTPIADPILAACSLTIKVPLQRYTFAEFAEARASLPKVGTREMPMLEQVAAVKKVGIDDYGVVDLPMEVQAFQLSSSVAAVALPGELFAELGLAIKRRSPYATTLVFELCNDYPGYIPTRRAFAEGGYEPANSKLEPGGGERLVDAAVALLKALKAGDGSMRTGAQ
ncbi:MAG TPA: hypothetical protein PJ982_00645 [Lacipirellulaceae bacterium]|nr:hypothetical protein [Lacipirellulaceae bacterium]